MKNTKAQKVKLSYDGKWTANIFTQLLHPILGSSDFGLNQVQKLKASPDKFATF